VPVPSQHQDLHWILVTFVIRSLLEVWLLVVDLLRMSETYTVIIYSILVVDLLRMSETYTVTIYSILVVDLLRMSETYTVTIYSIYCQLFHF